MKLTVRLTLTVLMIILMTSSASYGWISIIGSLSHEKKAAIGEVYNGSIIIKNENTKARAIKAYQADYIFQCDGKNGYREAGELERSNTKLLRFSPNRKVKPSESKMTENYSVKVRCKPVTVISFAGAGGRNWTKLVVDEAGIITEDHQLVWSTNCEGVKVTVQSNLGADKQNYILKVRAIELNSNGFSVGWVVVSDESSILITDIAREIGGCSLEYEASLKSSENTGPDEHIITYTITE